MITFVIIKKLSLLLSSRNDHVCYHQEMITFDIIKK